MAKAFSISHFTWGFRVLLLQYKKGTHRPFLSISCQVQVLSLRLTHTIEANTVLCLFYVSESIVLSCAWLCCFPWHLWYQGIVEKKCLDFCYRGLAFWGSLLSSMYLESYPYNNYRCKVFCSTLLLSNIPLYGYIIICLSIHQLIDICIVSSYGSLQIMPLLPPRKNSLCGYGFTVFIFVVFVLTLDKYIGVGLLSSCE